MTSAAPKAIKAFVTTVVKDQILESATDYSSDANDTAETPFMALLRMELIQRGVMVSLKQQDEHDISQWDATKTLEAVRSTVGKELLDVGGSVPTPLLAASAVMAGRVAELCASLIPPIQSFDQTLLKSTLDRCKEVQDDRFRSILESLLLNNNNKNDNDNDIGAGPSIAATTKQILLQMAEGYFLRGAHFQPDTQPMWKKACDVVLLRHEMTEEDVSSRDNAFALSNMVRIAASKGNDKQATELTVRLVESYLELSKQSGDSKQQQQQQQQDKNDSVFKAFVSPYKPVIKNPLEKAQQALEDCQKHLNLLSSDETFILHMLDVQIQLAKEDSHIEQEAQHQYQQAQNRAEEKPKGGAKASSSVASPAKPATLASIRDKIRNQVLRVGKPELDDNNNNNSKKSAIQQLRDAYLQRRSQSNKAITMRERSAASLLVRILNRSRDRAKALAKVKTNANMDGWSQTALFLLPFLEFASNACPKQHDHDHNDEMTTIQIWLESLLGEEIELVETFTTMIPCVEWMLCASSPRTGINNIPLELFPLVLHMLSVFVERAVQAKQEYQASSNVLKSSTEPMDLRIRELECARTSMQSIRFFQISETTGLRSHIEQAINMTQSADKYQAFSIYYGTAFWNMVLAWSGLQETPWAYCTAPEARLIHKQAERSIMQAKTGWGRPIAPVEQFILDLAQADLECGILAGGFRSLASKLYHATLKSLEASVSGLTDAFQSVLKSHCLVGLTRIALLNDQEPGAGEGVISEQVARQSLQELDTVSLDQEIPPTYLWTAPNATASFVRLHISLSRQLVADALVRVGRSQEAKKVLEDAVKDSPMDAEAAFSLGSFLLREAYAAPERSPQDVNAAKMQLLKAAKLNSAKAGPFALLGIWYEEQNDIKRALGCYSKALLLDPPHPVAGRGVLRLTPSVDSAKSVIDNATQTSSPVNGWAWRALGKQKVMITGENDLGAVALLKSLRCRDIDSPQNEPMSAFFYKPKANGENTDAYLGKEKAEAWADLAFAYRRLGRYTAAIRGYYSSMEAAGEHVEASVLCSCAEGSLLRHPQVIKFLESLHLHTDTCLYSFFCQHKLAELGLGLAEEAAEKFHRALEISGPSTRPIAAYGHGSALLSLARRDAQDGKAGAAYGYIARALEGFKESDNTFACTQKLLGDLYSFGASLPPDVFGIVEQDDLIENQISFVKKGEDCYRASLDHTDGVSASDDESSIFRAALNTDIGANILLQAHLTTFHHCKGLDYNSAGSGDKLPAVKTLYEGASAAFRRAIDQSSIYAPAWCGLGCAVSATDPLLAQHAFCRSIQLDSLSPDSYSNLGFLYTSYNSFSASNGVLDALTQVADSPLMWINRAMILERNAATNTKTGEHSKAREALSQAADAYRAALQVVKHPSALLGLALTSRVSSSGKGNPLSSFQGRMAFQDSYGYLLEYEGTAGTSNTSVCLLENLWTLERAANNCDIIGDGVLEEGRNAAENNLEKLSLLYQEYLEPRDRDNHLDLDIIKQCLNTDGAVSEDEEKSPDAPFQMTLARQIVHEPFRGSLWVKMAKEVSKDIEKSDSALESARLAASRAVDILSHQLTHPYHQAGAHQSSWEVEAKALSEALSLVHWLENVDREKKQEENGEGVRSAFELQKALMICPGNKFAREALLASSKNAY